MRAFRGIVCGLVLGSSLVPPAVAQPSDRDRWVVGQSENFTIYSNAKSDKTRQIAASLEQLRQIIGYLGSDVSRIERAPITFILFRDEQAFLPYMREPPTRGTVRAWEATYGEERDFVLLDAGKPPAEVFPWAFEAYSRYLIEMQYRELPFWLRVGLAYFYGTADVDARDNVRIGVPVERHVRQLRQHSMIPLAQFFRIEADSSFLHNPDNLRTYNAQVWAIAHMLMTGGGSEDPSSGRRIFQALSAGASPEQAIRSVYGVDLDDFEKTLYSYVKQPTMPVFTLKGDFLVDSEVALEPMSHDEASYQLGSYLVSAHDPPSIELVEAHLEPVVEGEGPRHADALAALAQLRRLTGRPEEAATLFDQAMGEAPADPLNYYRAADFLISQGSQDTEAIRRYLERAVDIEPGFARAWSQLAATYKGSDEVDQAIASYREALERVTDPAMRQWMSQELERLERTKTANAQVEAYNAAIALANEGRHEEALERLRELLPEIEDLSIRSAVENTIGQLEQYLAQK